MEIKITIDKAIKALFNNGQIKCKEEQVNEHVVNGLCKFFNMEFEDVIQHIIKEHNKHNFENGHITGICK